MQVEEFFGRNQRYALQGKPKSPSCSSFEEALLTSLVARPRNQRDQHLRRGHADNSMSAAGAFEDSPKIGVQHSVHLAPRSAGCENDAVDEAPYGHCHRDAVPRMIKHLRELRGFRSVDVRNVGLARTIYR